MLLTPETGKAEIYVRPFPDISAGRWVLSRDGGTEPARSASRRENFCRSASDSLVGAEVAPPGAAFQMGARHTLFAVAHYYSDDKHTAYAVTADGRFLFVRNLTTAPPRFVRVTNWFEELNAKVPR